MSTKASVAFVFPGNPHATMPSILSDLINADPGTIVMGIDTRPVVGNLEPFYSAENRTHICLNGQNGEAHGTGGTMAKGRSIISANIGFIVNKLKAMGMTDTTLVVIVAGANGGTGSTAGPLLVGELGKTNPVLLVNITTAISAADETNACQNIKLLEAAHKELQQKGTTLTLMNYINKDYGGDRTDVDMKLKDPKGDLATIVGLYRAAFKNETGALDLSDVRRLFAPSSSARHQTSLPSVLTVVRFPTDKPSGGGEEHKRLDAVLSSLADKLHAMKATGIASAIIINNPSNPSEYPPGIFSNLTHSPEGTEVVAKYAAPVFVKVDVSPSAMSGAYAILHISDGVRNWHGILEEALMVVKQEELEARHAAASGVAYVGVGEVSLEL